MTAVTMKDAAETAGDRPAGRTRLTVQLGLHGVTKVSWRTWRHRNWLSWTIAASFLACALVACHWTARVGPDEPGWHRGLRLGITIGWIALVIVRLVLEGTVSRPVPGRPPPWDKAIADPWWTTIHTLTGVVLGLWLVPLLVTVLATIAWEVLEIAVPGFGDEEINGNRMVDVLVAWAGWALMVTIAAVWAGSEVPLV